MNHYYYTVIRPDGTEDGPFWIDLEGYAPVLVRPLDWNAIARAETSLTEVPRLPGVLSYPEADTLNNTLEALGCSFSRHPNTPSGPIHCSRCNTPNEYAEPNQSDGSYVCYECRRT